MIETPHAVAVSALANPACLVEVEAVAVIEAEGER